MRWGDKYRCINYRVINQKANVRRASELRSAIDGGKETRYCINYRLSCTVCMFCLSARGEALPSAANQAAPFPPSPFKLKWFPTDTGSDWQSHFHTCTPVYWHTGTLAHPCTLHTPLPGPCIAQKAGWSKDRRGEKWLQHASLGGFRHRKVP